MNKHEHIELKPHIERICQQIGVSKEIILKQKNFRQPDIPKHILFYVLYIKIGSTYQNIANEFNISVQAVSHSVRKAGERLDDKVKPYLDMLALVK